MILRKYISFLVIGLSIISCAESNSENRDIEVVGNEETVLPVSQIKFEDEFLYEGSLIQLKEEGTTDEMYTIPEITKQRGDIKFTAKRIPTELYLKNKGVLASNLEEALLETEGEQLFYFDFEQEQKQDLVKKYLEDDLDANVSYLSFNIFKDFKAVTSKGDTIACEYNLYERNFHVAPYERVIISFIGVDQNEELRLLYKDELFGRGELDFTFASTSFIENNIKNPA